MEELRKKKNTPKVTYVFIVRKFTCHALSNHAHVHYPILMIGCEELEGFEKNMASQAKKFRLHSHSSIHITDLEQKKKHSAQTNQIYILMHLLIQIILLCLFSIQSPQPQ